MDTLIWVRRARFGESVSGAGDVDADGHDDLIVGSHQDQNRGTARVYSGNDGAALHTFAGTYGISELGYSVSGTGDVNGDGYDDLIVGAPSSRGHARVYSGLDGSTLMTVSGIENVDQLGLTVGGAGDVNNDGFADVLIGDGYRYGNDYLGRARVFSVSDSTPLRTFIGADGTDQFARCVAEAGDVNNDGYNDFFIGAYGDDDNGPQSGSAVVYGGAPCAATVTAFVSTGSQCPGTGGAIPSLSIAPCPEVGNTVIMTTSGALRLSPYWLIISPGMGTTPLPGGCVIDVVWPAPFIFGTIYGESGPGAGWSTLLTTIGVSSVTFYLQAVIRDSGVGLITTNALEIQIP